MWKSEQDGISSVTSHKVTASFLQESPEILCLNKIAHLEFVESLHARCECECVHINCEWRLPILQSQWFIVHEWSLFHDDGCFGSNDGHLGGNLDMSLKSCQQSDGENSFECLFLSCFHKHFQSN